MFVITILGLGTLAFPLILFLIPTYSRITNYFSEKLERKLEFIKDKAYLKIISKVIANIILIVLIALWMMCINWSIQFILNSLENLKSDLIESIR